jgi:adenylosuccinate lyase
MLHRLNNVIDKLVVHKENMYKNLMLTGGLVFSQRILLELPLKGVSREDAYAIVQKNAMLVWADLKQSKPAVDNKGSSLFLKYLLNDKKLTNKLSTLDIKKCFDISYYTKNVKKILKRTFK